MHEWLALRGYFTRPSQPRLSEQYRRRQRELLEAEEVKFDGWRIVGFAACRWDGLQGMEVLAFDTGETIVGVLDLNTGAYTPYRKHGEPPWTKGAQRVIECDGIVVSFNGNERDLPDLAEITGLESADGLPLRGVHCDMRVIASRDRWPPDPGTEPIRGECLATTYEHYFPDDDVPATPASIADEYEQHNWRDCWLAATLWKRLCGKIPA